MAITKAVIPVAGWGTRRLPITKAIEKAMLPIGNRPLVDYVVQDCIQAGIRDIYFIVSEGSTQLQAYYSENEPLNRYLELRDKQKERAAVQPPQGVKFHYLTQASAGKYGTAAAVHPIAEFLAHDESVVVLMGDDFIFHADGDSEVACLLQATPEGGCAMLGVNVPRADVGKYGVLELNTDGTFKQIVEKPRPDEAPSTLINVSKYVLNYEVIQEIVRYCEVERSGEYYITNPINSYVAAGGAVRVVEAAGQYLDGGTVEGWLQANNVVAAAELAKSR